MAIGKMYDPFTFSRETSALPAPNANEARDAYRVAAEAKIAEAQFLLGRLLSSGKTDDSDGPERGVHWLQQAADQGYDEAKKALPK